MVWAALILLPVQAVAVSFNCEAASSAAEQMVCSDPVLSVMDDRLATLYREAKVQDASLVESQRAWLDERDRCSTEGCVSHAYGKRISYLKQVLSTTDSTAGEGTSAKPEAEAHTAAEPTVTFDDKPAPRSPPTTASETTPATVPATVSGTVQPVTPAPPSSVSAQGQAITWLMLVAGLILLPMVLHARGDITIFENFTDLTFFVIAPLVIMALGSITRHYLESATAAKVVYAVGGLAWVLWCYLVSLRSNESHLRAIFALLARFAIGLLAVVVFLFSVMPHNGGSRQQGESYTAYELRLRRQRAEARRWRVIMAALAAFLAAFSCRTRGFVPLSAYFSIDGLGDMADRDRANTDGVFADDFEEDESSFTAEDDVSDRNRHNDDGGSHSGEQVVPWHEVLDVSPAASKAEVKAAYQKKIRANHPDRVMQMDKAIQELAEARSKRINEAYATAMSQME